MLGGKNRGNIQEAVYGEYKNENCGIQMWQMQSKEKAMGKAIGKEKQEKETGCYIITQYMRWAKM